MASLALALVGLAGCGGDDAAAPAGLPFAGRFVLAEVLQPTTGAHLTLPATLTDTLGGPLTIVGGTLVLESPALAADTSYGVRNDTGSASYQIRFQVRTAESGAVNVERSASGRYRVRSWVQPLAPSAGWDLTSDACFAIPAAEECFASLFEFAQWADRGPLWTHGYVGAATTQTNVGGTMRWTSSIFIWRRE